MKLITIAAAATLLVAFTARAGQVAVSATGIVVFNGIGAAPLSGVVSGETATMSFTVDSAKFVDGIPGDTRGYPIDEASFALSFSGGVSVGLLNPFPGTPYFTLVEGFPVSDGFFVSSSPSSPGGVALEQTPVQANLDLGYVGTTLSSLDIEDAKGTYGFDGLTRFAFNCWQIFPDNVVLDIDFQSLTIENTVSVDETSFGSVKSSYK